MLPAITVTTSSTEEATGVAPPLDFAAGKVCRWSPPYRPLRQRSVIVSMCVSDLFNYAISDSSSMISDVYGSWNKNSASFENQRSFAKKASRRFPKESRRVASMRTEAACACFFLFLDEELATATTAGAVPASLTVPASSLTVPTTTGSSSPPSRTSTAPSNSATPPSGTPPLPFGTTTSASPPTVHSSSDMTYSTSNGSSFSFRLDFLLNFCFNFLLYMMYTKSFILWVFNRFLLFVWTWLYVLQLRSQADFEQLRPKTFTAKAFNSGVSSPYCSHHFTIII
ncbi:hypothetical protein LXL04_002450 [Taraxacum kok-saghyz]